MEIRLAEEHDYDRIMEIYHYARSFMAAHSNPNQWGPTNWPPAPLIHQDIARRRSYVCIHVGRIVGTFFFAAGKDIEPTYRNIEDGSWLDNSPYGVVHRLAGDGSVRGIGQFCLQWAYNQTHHLRVDTHTDNIVMQNLLRKMRFTHCGTIYVEEDPYPRLAYEKYTSCPAEPLCDTMIQTTEGGSPL